MARHYYEEDKLENLISEGKQLIDNMVEKADIVQDLMIRMKYQEYSKNVCANCQHADDDEEFGLECHFNPIYPFGVSPAGTCAHFKKTALELNV
jgi:hypothetical protein